MQEDRAAPLSNILLVDDDENSLYALQEMLAPLGQNLVVAHSGAEALRAVLRNDFAVILLDVRMPRMDGFEAARLIRERRRSSLTPIIFLTGQDDDLASAYRGYEAGAVDYLTKPVTSPAVLRSKVAVFVELHRKSTDLSRQIAERMAVEERLKESEEKLRRLAAYLISVREEERTHIAREIHDELGQALTGLKIDLAWLRSRLTDRTLVERVQSVIVRIDGAMDTVRRIATDLRPSVLDDLGLVAAVEWQAQEFERSTGIQVQLEVNAEHVELEDSCATTAFRILQETLTNVARHAQATRVHIALRVSAELLTLEVRDNGRGISKSEIASPRSLGLLGSRERAKACGGELAINGINGQGTTVSLKVPLEPAAGFPS